MSVIKVNFSKSCCGDCDKSKLIIELMLTDPSAKSLQRRLGKSLCGGAEGEALWTQQSPWALEARSTREGLPAWLSTQGRRGGADVEN